MVNFVSRDTEMGSRVYAIPEGTSIPPDYDQGSLDRLPGYYRNIGGKFKAILKRPFHAEKVFDTELEAQSWLGIKIDRGY